MNLAIDIGNSSCKAGLYDRQEKVSISIAENPDDGFIENIISEYKIRRTIISSVRKEEPLIKNLLESEGIPVIILSYTTPLPFRMLYETPETLGTDRLAAVAGAHELFPETNVLVIDAGTAITYDLLDSVNNYVGGNISPGLHMRFRALHEFTGRLPMVSRSDIFGNLGVNTGDAIRSGVQTGLIFEINEYIRNLKNNYSELEVIITGGDAEFFSGKIEEKCTVSRDLVVDGLNYILNYNA